jgi:trigger factor
VDYSYDISEDKNCTRILDIEIPKEAVTSKFDEVYKMLKREAKIPGFRPGKAPLSVIKSRFGREAEAEVADQLVQEAVQEIVKEAKLNPIAVPVVSKYELKENEPLKFTASVEIAPDVQVEKCDGFTFTKMSENITDDNVEQAFASILDMQSSLEPSDQPAKKGDFVTVNMKKVSDPENRLKKDEFKDYVIELNEDSALPAFIESLTGAKVGDEKEILIEYPADYPEKSLAGARLGYMASVTSVKTKVAPELEDEFFKKFGEGIGSLDELKDKIRQDLQARRKKEIQEDLRDQAIKSVIQHNQFEMPQSLIETYLDDVVEDFREKYRSGEFDEGEVREKYRALAIRMIRWNLLMHKIAEQKSIEAEKEDIDKWIENFADSYNMSLENARETLERSRKVQQVKETVLEAKVMSHILDHSEIVDA